MPLDDQDSASNDVGINAGDVGINAGDVGINAGDVGINTGDVGINTGDVGINGTAKRITALLRENDKVSATQIAKAMAMSSRQVERILSQLKRVGIIVRIGANKTGSWQVVDR